MLAMNARLRQAKKRVQAVLPQSQLELNPEDAFVKGASPILCASLPKSCLPWYYSLAHRLIVRFP
jgi:hypothetical protein